MAEPVRHRQTKGAATDMFDLQPPRHISTLRNPETTKGPLPGHSASGSIKVAWNLTSGSVPLPRLLLARVGRFFDGRPVTLIFGPRNALLLGL